ncbi:hypothetical protein DFH06DRAFT_1213841 [Mycena polygramma]|nr:hypothetical protein DFH06DRAFT_1213841 [Mycena polygramma]
MRFISLVFVSSILWGASSVASLPVENAYTPSETGCDTFIELDLPATQEISDLNKRFEGAGLRTASPGGCVIA